jgi:bifunctional UDP-N-acetylglucosamine pyrophosphorylase / glucosamine-1-phosphate N-acetyltransferase
VSSPDIVLIIPAAGAGIRLQSPTPKLLTPVNGRAMIDHLFALYRSVAGRFVVVVHPSLEPMVKAHCEASAPDLQVDYARQSEPTGMLDALLLAADAARRTQPARVWVTWCDQVGIRPETIERLRHLSSEQSQAHIVMPTSLQETPYIHFERAPDGRITAVRQRREGEAMPAVGESDIGLFSLSHDGYFTWLPRFGATTGRSAETRERNFLPFVPWMAAKGHRVVTFPCTDEMEAVGINTPEDHLRLERYLRERDRS